MTITITVLNEKSNFKIKHRPAPFIPEVDLSVQIVCDFCRSSLCDGIILS
jgi:hypothetical protein